jgi:hypothetical protein
MREEDDSRLDLKGHLLGDLRAIQLSTPYERRRNEFCVLRWQ